MGKKMPINTKELDAKLEVLLKKVFKIQKIDLEVSIVDISEWDSLTHVQLISAIEKEFKIKIKFDDVMIMTSIPIIKKKIMNYL
jgi:acyl carrier protein